MPTLEAKPAQHKIVSGDAWVKTRKALLVKEKKLSHQRDALHAYRVVRRVARVHGSAGRIASHRTLSHPDFVAATGLKQP